MHESDFISSQPARRLFYVPILHTAADMGTLATELRKEIGDEAWNQRQQMIHDMWQRVEFWADSLGPSLANFRIYQDGLPLCGLEMQIVNDLAQQGSRNHRLLLKLIERGATLVGTESTTLLVDEYQLAREIVASASLSEADRTALRQRARSLIAARDAFIAEQINQTLSPGETAVLFIGMLHNVHRDLDTDIDLTIPFATQQDDDHDQQQK